MRINLDWSRNDTSRSGKRSPRPAFSTTGSAPPYKDKKLSSRFDQHQKPAHGPAGVFKQNGRGTTPTLRHVVAEDLRDPTRLLELFRQAAIARLVSTSECDRLRFFAAAEHAKAIGTRNPCGLFATLARRKLWHFITQDDEDAANARLKQTSEHRFLVGTRGESQSELPPEQDRYGDSRVTDLTESDTQVAHIRRLVEQSLAMNCDAKTSVLVDDRSQAWKRLGSPMPCDSSILFG
ncbi:MAG TPA: hypothetical protein VJZ71_05845 [Phycisphaerae bacterium]|nr:hypothetical protein [Phycisphaerae bacterium]